jgi:hypothetical protein
LGGQRVGQPLRVDEGGAGVVERQAHGGNLRHG